MEEKIVFACIRISCSILFEFSVIFVDLCQSDFSESLLRIDLQKLDYMDYKFRKYYVHIRYILLLKVKFSFIIIWII